MRTFISLRWQIYAIVLLALLTPLLGAYDPTQGILFFVVVAWLLSGCPLLSLLARWKPEPVVRVKVSSAWVRRDAGIDGCINRLDPVWQDWLIQSASNSSEVRDA